ncbi:molybdopterin molybdotransferase MoeA [Halopenitus persicus]|uniref:Molybdopterin molybdotransferase n=1 Tax=Halopenitus persicus TaxID=1048396 RepID=A0A1H3P0C6_9EURY|nr:molybdopterin molybdotransferase MoeA [Halopenitus persicus]SDY94245.1 molybdopterin molybdotransferase [Halopenitus persicus]
MGDWTERVVAVKRLRACLDTHVERDAVRVTLGEIAGRTVAEAVVVPTNVPDRPFATMDGYALATADTSPRPISGSVETTDAPDSLVDGTAARVATGAPLPKGADAVVPIEEAIVKDGRLVGSAPAAGQHLYPAGATAAQGETVFEPGDRLAPRHASLLRDVGIDRVSVRSRPTVGILATGTEIVQGDQPDRDSAMLASLLREWGMKPAILDPVPDDRRRIVAALERAAARHDLVVTSGGTSVGAGDHVGSVLADHDPIFTGVALRPGRPTTAAIVDGTPVCALPGKPVAAHTAATLLLRPALVSRTRDSVDPTVTVPATNDVAVPDTDVEYAVPVSLRDGCAVPTGQGNDADDLYGKLFKPGRVASSTRVTLADGVVITTESIAADQPVSVTPYGVIE